MRVSRRFLVLAACTGALVAAAVPGAATGSGLEDRKEQVDARIAALRNQIAHAKDREGVLSSQIASASAEIGSLEDEIGVLSDRVDSLAAQLAAHRARLTTLRGRLAEQTRRLDFLVGQHRIARKRLEQRLVELYETDSTSTLEIFLQAGSLQDVLDQVDYFNAIGRQDRAIVERITRLRDSVRVARARTASTEREVAETTEAIARKTAEERAARDSLVTQRSDLAAARSDKESLLAGVRSSRRNDEEDLASMQAASARLGDQIRAAQAAAAAEAAAAAAADQGSSSSGSSGSSGSAPSSSGFIWPVSGPVVSGFGMRWGRMHEGIDIAVPEGTAVHAAAAGQIIFAGVESGYGNIVVIDHGNGLATAYAHLSSIWVGGGTVTQGQAIAASGCTGHCLGPHVHFEVRVNGAPVDPLGYL